MYHIFYGPCTGGLFAQLAVCKANIWKVCPYPIANLFQLRGAWSFKFYDNMGMNTTSSLVLNDIKHEIAFEVCQKGSELHFEDTVNSLWAIHPCLAFV